MSTPHTSDHERMLEALVVGDAGRDAARVRAELSDCAACGPRIVELGVLARGLSDAGRVERADLAQAGHMPYAPGSERVATTLRNTMAAERRPSVPAVRRRNVWPWVAAAGLLATLVLVLAPEKGPDRHANGGTLGTPRVELLEPKGQVPEFRRFAWTGDLPPNGTFKVSVFDPAATDRGRIVDHETRERDWHPTLEETAGWPRQIEWQVSIYVGKVNDWTSSLQSASRSH